MARNRDRAPGRRSCRVPLPGRDSDAHIVRGLIAILFAIYSGKTADDLLSIDAEAIFAKLGLKEHLTPQRSNGFAAMVERIRTDTRHTMSEAAKAA